MKVLFALALVGASLSTQALAQTAETIKEPALITPNRLAPLPPDNSPGEVVDVRIKLDPKPVYRKRLAAIRDQIDTGEAKGWITGDVANDLKRRQSEILSLVEAIPDPKNRSRELIDDIEQKTTTLNADVYAAFHKTTVEKGEPEKQDSDKPDSEKPGSDKQAKSSEEAIPQ